jgi:hypothetical protein
MIFSRPTRFFLILVLLWSLLSPIIFAEVVPPIKKGNCAFCGSLIDHDPDNAPSILQTCGGVGIVLGWPKQLVFAINYNNLPKIPNVPAGIILGVPVATYNFSAYTIDLDGDQVKYTLDWGDGTISITDFVYSGTAASANHTWVKAGTYLVKANAMDSRGASSGWSEPLIVTINTPPNNPLTPSGPSSGKPGTSKAYNLSATDLDGDQIEYLLDWGDGTTSIISFIDSGILISVNHTWIKAGTYLVRANVTDSRGASSGWSLPLTVNINAPPDKSSIPHGPQSVYAWASYGYSASTVDPDEDPIKYTFDWGDGDITTTNFIESGSNISAQHKWSNTGTYKIKVSATDRRGDSSEWSENLTITVTANDMPNVPRDLFGPIFGYTGISNSYFTMAKDIDGDLVKYSFDWGDGTISSTGSVNSGSVESAPHIWRKAGTYHVRANATDSKGASSGWSESLNVSIAENDPPNMPIIPSGPTSGRSKSAYKYATSAKDPDGDLVKYVFDWGDKTTSWTGLIFINSGTNECVSHKWSKAGTYQVKAMALDDKGAASGWSNSLVVNIIG